MDADAQRRLGIVVGRATAGRLAPTRSTVARLEAPPDQLALVAAPVDGRLVARPGGLPRPGTVVRRGELLATLVPTPSAPEITTRVASDLSRATADVEAARLTLDRARALLAEGAVPERRVVDAERDLGVAEAALASARQTSAFAGSARGGRGGAGWRVVAAIDGVIDATFVSDGQTVAAHTPLFRVVGDGERWVVVSVPETWAPTLGSSPRGFFRLAGEANARPLEHLVDVGRVVDPHTRTVDVRFAVEADPALRVGAAANAELTFGEVREGFLVPRDAVLDLDGRRIVVLRVADDEFLERDVSVAVRAGDQLLLAEGVTAEDAVVLEGAALVHLAKGGGGEVHDGHVH
ncbi:MAG: efflux RND transporter periplasmic adaptor subunit [Myxococcales bacterium]|nr:efflux RND transporter periplasmic adaptor subunit [Myxococcales bacterium]